MVRDTGSRAICRLRQANRAKQSVQNVQPDQGDSMNTNAMHEPIPFQVEHKVKTTIQHLMEEALFTFCQKVAPQALVAVRWSAPEMTELSLFAGILRPAKVALVARKGLNQSLLDWEDFMDTLDQLKHLRHTAVHRRPIGAISLDNMLTDCVVLLETIQDAERRAKVAAVRELVERGEWPTVLIAADTSVDAFKVFPFYGRNFEPIDLTADSDEEEADEGWLDEEGTDDEDAGEEGMSEEGRDEEEGMDEDEV